jgi:hypothetical protein
MYEDRRMVYFEDEDGLLCFTQRPCAGVIVEENMVNVLLASSFHEEGNAKYVVMTGVLPTAYLGESFRALSPAIDGAVFSKIGDVWQMVTREHSILTVGNLDMHLKDNSCKSGRSGMDSFSNAEDRLPVGRERGPTYLRPESGSGSSSISSSLRRSPRESAWCH